MKKTLMAMAVLAAVAQAHAQSSVSMFGNVDVTFARGSGSIADRTQLTSGGQAASVFGFRGIEDLGGGLKAGFWLESQFASDAGNGTGSNTNNQTSGAPPAAAGGQGLVFNRRSIVSIGSTWGQFILGRDYTPTFGNHIAFDPYGNNGVGSTQIFAGQVAAGGPYGAGTNANSLSARASNSLSYAYGFAPNGTTLQPAGGLYVHLMHFLGENASNSATPDDGSGSGARVGYIGGPVHVALAYMVAENAAGDLKSTSLGGSYDFGIARVRAMVTRDQFGAREGKGALLAASIPAGPAGQVRASYSRYKRDTAGNPESGKLALGYSHSLSKRTSLYATFARVNNKGGASSALNGAITGANASSSGYDLGVRHTF